jgi:hypothetical protein
VWVITHCQQVLGVCEDLDMCVLLVLIWQAGVVVYQHTPLWPPGVATAAKDNPVHAKAAVLLVLLQEGVDVMGCTAPSTGAAALLLLLRLLLLLPAGSGVLRLLQYDELVCVNECEPPMPVPEPVRAATSQAATQAASQDNQQQQGRQGDKIAISTARTQCMHCACGLADLPL